MDPLQVHSVQGYWEKPPIKISFKNGDWNASEIGAIQAGAKTWNTFFGASKGFAIFDQGPDGTGNTSNSNQAGPTCSGGTLGDGAVIYRRASGWTKSKSAIAVTTTCYRNNTGGNSNGVPILYNAIMEFNYVDFFMSGTKCPSTGASPCVPDIQSIALHELGHLLGLDHACGPLGAPNQSKSYMGCPNAATDPDDPIISTVMFPTVFFDTSGTGEVKQKLTENDQGRANCAYLDF